MRVTSSGKVMRSEAEWREIFNRCEASGLSRKLFCEREKISTASFGKWKRRLSSADEAKASSFVELLVPSEPAASVSTPERTACEFKLSFPGGVVLRWTS